MQLKLCGRRTEAALPTHAAPWRDQVHSICMPRRDYTGGMRESSICNLRWTHLLAAVLSLTLLCTAAQAQWTWRDKDGRVTASDLPPPRDIPEKDIISRPAPRATPARNAPAADAAASAATATRAAPVDRELEARKKAADAEKAAQAKAEESLQAQRRGENCRRARAQITALENGQRMARVNDKGEREVLDDKGRAEELRRARDIVTSDCR